MSLIDDVMKGVRALRLEELKLILGAVQSELSKRKEVGNEKTVSELMSVARQYGWVQERDGDVVRFIERRLKEQQWSKA